MERTTAGPQDELAEARPPERVPAPAPAVAQVLGLQQSAGNAAVSRMLSQAGPSALQREGLPDGATYSRERAAREAWMAEGVRGPEDFRASTHRGGFEVAYVPRYMAMNVVLKGGVDFKDGITLAGGNATVTPGARVLPAVVNRINALPAAERAAAAAPFQWDDAGRTTFLTDFERVVESAWHRQHEFHCSKQYWEDLGAVVNVIVQVHAGAKSSDDHMKATCFKVASEAETRTVGLVTSFQPTVSTPESARDNTMTLNSTDVNARGDIQLTRRAAFTAGADTLTPAGVGVAQGFGGDFKDGGGPRCGTCGTDVAALAGTTVHARVQGTGADPQASARTRFTAVTNELVTGGMTNAATRVQFEYAGEGDEVTLVMGSGQQQVIAAHEAGHMFGLGDEYDTAFGGRATGTAVNADLGPAQNLPGAVTENTDSMMSLGMAVRPQHYATFLEGLKHVTGMQEWVFGPPQGVLPPGVDGPLPQRPRQPGEPLPEPATAFA